MNLDEASDNLCKHAHSIFCCETMGDDGPGNAGYKFAGGCHNAVKDYREMMMLQRRNRRTTGQSLEPGAKLKTPPKKRIVIPPSEVEEPKGSVIQIPQPIKDMLPEGLRQY